MAPKKIKKTLAYSVVVPVYNSEGSLKLLHHRLSRVFATLNSNWELILVNDCSRDNSWEVMQDIANNDSRVIAVNLTNNFGQHNAIMCGFSFAKGKYVITMDDDLQHPPEEIVKLIKTITARSYGVVYGHYITKRHGTFRDLCSQSVNNIISRITGSGYKVTSFRIIEHLIVRKLLGFKQYNIMIDVLIKDIVHKTEVGHCWVAHHSRKIGKSNYSFKKLFSYAINMIFNYTLWPLHLASILGFLFAFLSILLGIYFFIYNLLYQVPVRGWTSLILIITFFSGIILFVLGIMGEYMGKIYLNINKKPQYFIKEVFDKQSNGRRL